MNKIVFTNAEIIEETKKLLGLETNTSLQEELEVSKQSLYQFKNREFVDINNKIATALIRELKARK
jgi:hypothetical protein